MTPPPIKPFKRFTVTIVETDENLDNIGTEHVLNFGANGNPELFAKVGQFVRRFSEDSIPDWRKSL